MTDEGEECIHLIFPASACVICSKPQARPRGPFVWDIPNKAMSDTVSMEASHRSQCIGRCQGWIEPGDVIVPLPNGKWVHDGCD